MILGLAFTVSYIVYFKFIQPDLNLPAHWFLGISPEGIGTVGMLLNFSVTIVISLMTKPPPESVQAMVEQIRLPERDDSPAHVACEAG
jgi:cation/acetate symporter